MKIVLRRAAELDMVAAAEWYEGQRAGLGAEFLDAVGDQLDSIGLTPHGHPRVMKNVRRALLRRFPYGMFYIEEDGGIVVVACFHARQDPKRWGARR